VDYPILESSKNTKEGRPIPARVGLREALFGTKARPPASGTFMEEAHRTSGYSRVKASWPTSGGWDGLLNWVAQQSLGSGEWRGIVGTLERVNVETWAQRQAIMDAFANRVLVFGEVKSGE
jgi:hypothetical protein